MITSVTGQDAGGSPDELRLLLSWFAAEGYKQMIRSCEEKGETPEGMRVNCTFDFHAIRSDEIGRGPFSGSSYDFIVRDGKIVRATLYWELSQFGSQVWEPFITWMFANYPDDADAMYTIDASVVGPQLNEESIRLWDLRSREYAEVAK